MQGVAIPSDSVYQGTDAILFCCINMDPRTFVNDDGVSFFSTLQIVSLVAEKYKLLLKFTIFGAIGRAYWPRFFIYLLYLLFLPYIDKCHI